MNKKESFDEISAKLRALYNGHDHKEFIFVHGDPESEYANDPAGYDMFTGFNADLIILLLYLKKFFPEHSFFKNKGYSNQIKNYRTLSKKSSGISKQLKLIENDLDELKKKFPLTSDFIALNLEKSQLNVKKDVIAEEINSSLILNYSFLKSNHRIHGEYAFFYCWEYLGTSIALGAKIKDKFKDGNDYVFKLISKIPSNIINEKFDLLINSICKVNNQNNLGQDLVRNNLIKFLLSKLNFKSICSNNFDDLLLENEKNKNIEHCYVPALDTSYYEGDLISEIDYIYPSEASFDSSYNQQNLNYYSKFGKKPIIFNIKNTKTNEKKWDLVILDIRKTLSPYKFIRENFKKQKRYLFIVSNKQLDRMRHIFYRLGKIESLFAFKNNSIVSLSNLKNISNVELIDAKSYSDLNLGVDINKLIKDINKKDRKIYRSIQYENFIKQNSLSINRYFQPDFEGYKLSKIFERINNNSRPKVGELLIKIRDLNEIPTTINTRNLNSQGEEELNRSFIKIEESCLLIAKNGDKLKPTIFKFNKTPVYISKSILVLKFKKEFEKKNTFEFIQYELNSQHIFNQLKYIKRGAYIPFYSAKDLMNLKAVIPDEIESQNRIINERKVEYLEKSRYKSIIDQQLNKIKEDLFEKYAALNHDMGTPMVNMRNHIQFMLKILKSTDEAEVNNKLNLPDLKLKQRLLSVLENIEQINGLRKKYKNIDFAYTEKSYPLEIISSKEFYNLTEKIVLENKSELFEPKIELKIEEALVEIDMTKELKKYNNLGIRINADAYRIFIQEFFTNTKKHAGFKKFMFKENELKFVIKFSENSLFLEIMNNGEPFDKKYDKKTFITWGQTSNSLEGDGIGGNTIEKISNLFQINNWEISSSEKYNVHFSFCFPLENIADI